MVIANIVLDYASSIGLMSLFVPVGLWYLVNQKDWKFETRLLLSLVLLDSGFVRFGQYTILVVLPLLSVLCILGLFQVLRLNENRVRIAAWALAIVLVSTMASSSYMLDRWRSEHGESVFVDSNLVAASMYLREIHLRGFFVSNDWLFTSYKVWSLSGNPPVAADLSIPIIEGVLSPDELDIRLQPSALSFYVISSGLQDRTHWLAIMIQDLRSAQALHVLEMYNVRYFLERRDYANPSSILIFLIVVHETQYKVYDDGKYILWTVPRQ